MGNKKMLIPMDEFVENGGVLTEGRELFANDSDNLIGYYKEYDDVLMVHLATNGSYKSFPIVDWTLVEIEVNPIYK